MFSFLFYIINPNEFGILSISQSQAAFSDKKMGVPFATVLPFDSLSLTSKILSLQ
jgi:hypothetical protein